MLINKQSRGGGGHLINEQLLNLNQSEQTINSQNCNKKAKITQYNKENLHSQRINDKSNLIKVKNKGRNAHIAAIECTRLKCANNGDSMNNRISTVDTKRNKTIRTTLQLVVWLFVLVLSIALMNATNINRNDNLNNISVTQAYSGGEGIESNPYQIKTFADLQSMATNINAGTGTESYYKLMNDITITSTSWTPIGKSLPTSARFKGNFDGQGHKITFNGNVTISIDYAGLFGYVDDGTIQNLGVHWNSLTGSGTSVGGIAGYNYSRATIINCYNTGSVTGTSSSSQVGGIAGYNGGTISNCYNTGSVTGSGTNLGGIAGVNIETISNCYNTGSVTGSGIYVGGIAGNSLGIINNCFVAYSGTAITIQGRSVGGVVYTNYGTVTNCYYDSGIQFKNASGGSVTPKKVTGVTAEGGLSSSLQSQNGFSSRDGLKEWDFTDTWVFIAGENNNFPVLRAFYNLYTVTFQINNGTEAIETLSAFQNETLLLQSPEDMGYTYAGYEFLYWTDSANNQYSAGEEITVSQNMTLTAQWEQAKSTIDFTITNNTGDTVLVVFKYKDSIATFRVVGDISATSGVTKKYLFKIVPQNNCTIYIIGGSYSTTLTMDGVPSTPSGNPYTIDCSSAVTMVLTINN